MKKLILSAAVIATITFSACSSNDDDDDESNCKTCEQSVGNTSVEIEYCDNGNGTYSSTTNGQTRSLDLKGASFSQFISAAEDGGATCN
jgi:hypothetical protein